MERGAVSAGRNQEAGKDFMPKLELVRLILPRRVYTQAHMDVMAASVGRVMDEASNLDGLKYIHEPEYLRFFRARFAPVEAVPSKGETRRS